MSAAKIYEAGHIKRDRATKTEVGHRRDSLFEIVEAMKPMTVRQVFYQASVRGIVEKSEAGYAKVQVDLVLMRRSGRMPYGWLTDSTRWQRKPRTFGSPQAALKATAQFYRKDLWEEIASYAEIWLEKDALAGVITPVTEEFDVPLMVARGYASLSFLHEAAEFIGEVGVPTYIYHLGVELDAIEPSLLRLLVQLAIEVHLPPDQLAILKTVEASERQFLVGLVGALGEGGAT